MLQLYKNKITKVFKTAFLFFFLRCYLFLERGEGKEKERETSMCGCLCVPLTGNLAVNPGMCPEWESNGRLFGFQAHTQSTELHQPELKT